MSSSIHKLMLWELRISLFGAKSWPAFYVLSDISPDSNDAPARKYFLYCKFKRFGSSKLIGIAKSHNELASIREKWINVTEDFGL